MNERLEMKVKYFIQEVRRETINEVDDFLMRKHDEIHQLLENGNDLLFTTSGVRFQRLHEKRRELFKKAIHYLEASIMIHELKLK